MQCSEMFVKALCGFLRCLCVVSGGVCGMFVFSKVFEVLLWCVSGAFERCVKCFCGVCKVLA